jgi:hypothetical protein
MIHILLAVIDVAFLPRYYNFSTRGCSEWDPSSAEIGGAALPYTSSWCDA